MSLPSQLLLDIKELLINKGWTQGSYARTVNGLIIGPMQENAYCFCLSGAIIRVSDYDPIKCNIITDYLHRAADFYWPISIVLWNDKPSRTKEEVLYLVTKARELALSENS